MSESLLTFLLATWGNILKSMRRKKHPRKWNFKGHGSWALLVGKANSRNSQENSQQTTREHTLSRPLFPAVYGLEILPSHKSHTQTLPSGFWGWDLERGWDINVATSSNNLKETWTYPSNYILQHHHHHHIPPYLRPPPHSSNTLPRFRNLRSFSAIRCF